MKIAALKKAAEELGISFEDLVSYHTKDNKAFIEIDLKRVESGAADRLETDVFGNILAMSEDIGIDDWALNHDHYLYGVPIRKEEKPDGTGAKPSSWST